MRANRPDHFDPLEQIDDQTMLQAVIDGYGFAHTLVGTVTDGVFAVRGEAGVLAGERVLAAIGPALREGELLEISDTRTDPRFADTRMVTADPPILSALALLYHSPIGEPVGIVVVADTKPRVFEPAERGQMQLAVGMLEAQYSDILDASRAHAVQRALLPSDPRSPEGYDVDGCSIVHGNITGDYFDWSLLDEHTFVFGLAEVGGSGVAAGMLAAASRAALRSASMIGRARGLDLTWIAEHAAHTLRDDLVAAGTTVRAFYGSLNPVSGEVHYINAGFEPPLVARAGVSSAVPETPPRRGNAVGVDAMPSWPVESVVLKVGDTLILPSAAARAVLVGVPELGRTASEIVDVVETYARAHPKEEGIAVLALHRSDPASA